MIYDVTGLLHCRTMMWDQRPEAGDLAARTQRLQCACVPSLCRGPRRSGGMPPPHADGMHIPQSFADAWQHTIFDVRSSGTHIVMYIISSGQYLTKSNTTSSNYRVIIRDILPTQRRHATTSRPSLPSLSIFGHENLELLYCIATPSPPNIIHTRQHTPTYLTHPRDKRKCTTHIRDIMGSLHHTILHISTF